MEIPDNISEMSNSQKNDDLAKGLDTSLQTTMRARIEFPSVQELPDREKRICQSILQTRRNLDGPFLAWLHSPEFADRAEKLGAFCRYETQFPEIESELLILVVAAHFHCSGEWQIHEPTARSAGIDGNTIEILRTGGTPAFEQPRLRVLYAFACELLSLQHVTDPLFAQAKEMFGVGGLVEVVGVIGYYSLVAMTLNAFGMQLLDADDPFELRKKLAPK